jgi:hypothetical protein
MEKYSPKEIIKLFIPPQGLQAHNVAELVSAFWPVIEEALINLDNSTNSKKFTPRRIYGD